jgi:hypothetical protein
MDTLAFTVLASTVVRAADDPVPKDDDVVAGPWGAVIFVLLILATVFLLISFTKQLRKAQAAKDAGVYGDPPATDEDVEPAEEPAEGPGEDGRPTPVEAERSESDES